MIRQSVALFTLGLGMIPAVAEPGPAVGGQIPEFSAPDQTGAARTFASLRGPNGLMLVFYRSADWWPYCKSQLVELEESREIIRGRGLGIAAISYDSAEILRDFAARKKITIPLLSDRGSEIIRAFGILNESVPKDSGVFGIPHPVTFVTDRDGKVVSKHFEQDIRDRFTASNILRIRSGGREIATKRLTLRSSGSNAVVRGGERVRLSVEVKLKPRMHVYAPGVTGYIPIEWKMDESAAAKVHPTEFPRAARIHLKAIQETVPAYEGQFTLDREVTFAQEKAIKPLLNAEGELTLSGSFRYQACDDKKCYLPETVPLKWTFRFEPHDPTRVAPELQHKLGTRR